TLRAKDARKLNLPWQIHKTVSLEHMAQCKIGTSAVYAGAVIKHASFRNIVAVAGKECGIGVAAARTGAVAGVGYNRGHTDETIGRVGIPATKRSGIQVGVEGIVMLRDIGVAATDGKAIAHPLFKRKDSSVVSTGVPRTISVDESSGRVIV